MSYVLIIRKYLISLTAKEIQQAITEKRAVSLELSVTAIKLVGTADKDMNKNKWLLYLAKVLTKTVGFQSACKHLPS